MQDNTSTLPELNLRVIVLGLVLSVIMGSANVYLGLKAGMTVSASIPAAVVGMLALKYFSRMSGKPSSILEANQIQTFENASIFMFLILHKISKGIEPKKTLIKAIVIGPNESVANLILKKAEAQTIARKINNE